ncbi:MAG: FHA domain-containing protein [Planctomycetes bacterium]|nr:FHA domain-containing protein [Planctomycetota bacterium]
MIPIRTLRAEAMSLGEEQFVARHPTPALVLDAPEGPAAGDPMAWLSKTVVDEDGFDRTLGVMDPGLTPSPEVDLSAASARSAVFFVRKAARQKDLFPDMVTIGRVPNNDIVLAYPTVSKVHAYLRRDGDGWRLHDHRSRNGTFVDQRRLPSGGAHDLVDGAVVHVGPSLALWFLLPPSLYGFIRGGARERPRG